MAGSLVQRMLGPLQLAARRPKSSAEFLTNTGTLVGGWRTLRGWRRRISDFRRRCPILAFLWHSSRPSARVGTPLILPVCCDRISSFHAD